MVVKVVFKLYGQRGQNFEKDHTVLRETRWKELGSTVKEAEEIVL